LRILSIYEKRSKLELFVLSAACGFAIISEGLLILGMIGFFKPLVISTFILILFVLSVKEARYFLAPLFSSCSSFSFSFSTHYVVGVAFILFVFINILKALLPPHGPTDVLYYHMTLPKLYLIHGSIQTYPTFFPSFFPSNGELIFSLCLLLGGPVFANLTHFGFALLTVIALYAYAQKYFRKQFALLPGIIYLTSPVINSWGTMAYTGNILGFYLFLLCMIMVEYNSKTNWKEALVGGLLTGMALGIKYQAIPLIALIYFFFFIFRIKDWRKISSFFGFSLIIGILLASPWFVRNIIVTKNPFFPVLRDLFPSELIWSKTTWGADTKGGNLLLIAGKKIKENPLSPFSLIFSGAWRNDDFQRFIGPLFLGFFPFSFFLKRNLVKWPFIILIFFLTYLSFLFLRGNIRYVIILIILLSFICGAVGQEIYHFAKKGERVFFTLFLTGVILLYSIQNYHLMLSNKRILTALNPRLTPYFLRAFERSYRVAEFANQNLPSGSKVLFHGFVRYFYFDFDPINDHIEQRVIIYDDAKNGEDILHILKNHGITHIISQDVIPERARSHTILYDQDYRFREFTRKYLEKIFSANGISIYKIRYN
jgi:hypothetical protein